MSEDFIRQELQRYALNDLKKAIELLEQSRNRFLKISEANIGSRKSKKLDAYLEEYLAEHCPYLTLDTAILYQ